MDLVREAVARSGWSALGQALGMGVYRRFLKTAERASWLSHVAMDALIALGALGASHLLQESLLSDASAKGSLLRAEGMDASLLGGAQLVVHGSSDALASIVVHLAWDASGLTGPAQNFVTRQLSFLDPGASLPMRTYNHTYSPDVFQKAMDSIPSEE